MSKKQISSEAQAILSAADAGFHATTVALVKQFLNTNPDSVRAWLDLGQALGQLARYQESESAFLKVIELSGDDTDGAIYGEIGNLYRAKGEFDRAISWYQKQIETEPNDAVGYLYLGNILLRQGKFEASEMAFNQALGCEQACLEEVHFSLGRVNRCMGRLPESKTHFEKALKLDEHFAEAKTAIKDVNSAMAVS